MNAKANGADAVAEHGRERRIARDHDCDEQHHGKRERGVPCQHPDYAQARGHAFSAVELQENRPIVPDDCRKTDGRDDEPGVACNT